MLKLYKKVDQKIKYWETWDQDEKTGVVHWGEVGERGNDKKIKSGIFSNFRKQVQKEINQVLSEGYEEIDIDAQYTLLIEYKVDGMGATEDLEKRIKLQERMDGTLGWTGLGHCDGGSIGSGTMEVCCFVVDFEIAKKVIERDLQNTEFADYSRIFDENE